MMFLIDAYNSGIIDDEVLEELSSKSFFNNLYELSMSSLGDKAPTLDDYKFVDKFLKEHDDYYKKYTSDEYVNREISEDELYYNDYIKISLSVYYADREKGIYLYKVFDNLPGMTAQIFDRIGDYVIRYNSNYNVPEVIYGDDFGSLYDMPDEVLDFVVSQNSGFNYDEAEQAILERLTDIGKDYFDIAEINEKNTNITPYYADYERDFYMFEVTFDEFDYDAMVRYETVGNFTLKYTGGDKIVYIIYRNEIGTAKDMYEKYKDEFYDYLWGNCNFRYDGVLRNGDVNNDKTTDIVDVALLRKAIVDNQTYNVSEYGDINFDYDIDIADVVILRSMIIYG